MQDILDITEPEYLKIRVYSSYPDGLTGEVRDARSRELICKASAREMSVLWDMLKLGIMASWRWSGGPG
jgi:hypothetical protein